MGEARVEGNFSIFIDRNDPMAQRHRRLDNLIAQHRESSKFEDGVIDYNMRPLANQLNKQAKLATVNIQQKPLIALQNESRQKVLAEASGNIENFNNYARAYYRHARRLRKHMDTKTHILTLLNSALIILLLLFGLRLLLLW